MADARCAAPPPRLRGALFWWIGLGVLVLGAPAAACADEVLLVDGGRVEGTIVSESPTTGVRVLLKDNSTFTVLPELVKQVIYETDAPSTGLPKPAETSPPKTSVPPDAASTQEPAREGDPRPWHERPWVEAQQGAHVGFMAYGNGHYVIEDNTDGSLAGASGQLFAAIGVTPAVELRVGGELAVNVASGIKYERFFVGETRRFLDASGSLVAFGSLVFNTPGGVYRPYLGAGAGVLLVNEYSFRSYEDEEGTYTEQFNDEGLSPLARIDLVASPLHFCFGELREWVLDVRAPLSLLMPGVGGVVFVAIPVVSVGFGRVFY